MSKPNLEKLVAIVAANPGLEASALKGKGWRPNVHGSLRDAEKAGLLVYRDGWRINEQVHPSTFNF